MLAEFRKIFHSKDSKTNSTIIAILFVIAMILPQIMEQVKYAGNWMLSVNGNKIGLSKFRERYQRERQNIENYKRIFGGKIDLRQLNIDTDPISATNNGLINDTLANEIAAKINLEINPEVIKKRIIEMLPAGKTLKEVAKQAGIKIADIEEQVKQDIINNTVNSLALGGLYIPEFMLKKNYIDQYAKKKFEILLLKPKQVKNNGSVNEDIEKFYEKMKAESYVTPETRKGVTIEFDPAKATLAISDVEIAGYYNEHKNQFIKDKPQVAVRVIGGDIQTLNTLAAGDLNALQEYAKQNPTKVKELTKFARGTHNKELEKQAFALQQKNEISPVFNDGKEDFIVQLVERYPTTHKTVAEIKDELKKAVALEKLTQALASFQPEQAAQLIKDFGGLEKAITVASADESTAAQKLFEMQIGEVNRVGDKNQLVRLDKIIPQAIQQFNDIKQKVAEDYYKLQAQEELQKTVSELLQVAQQETFQQLAKKYNADLLSTDLLVNGDKEWDKLIEKLVPQKDSAKIITALTGMNKTGEIITVVDGNAVVAKLIELQMPQEDYNSKKELIRSELLKNFVPVFEQGFIASLKRNAKIKINEKNYSK
jgi:hypothetical protein